MVATTALACAALAVLAALAGLAAGHPPAGLAVGAGLLVGSGNGWMARRALGAGIGFQATSLGRLAVLSAAGLGIGALLGADNLPLVLAGLAAAQLVLAIGAGVRMARV